MSAFLADPSLDGPYYPTDELVGVAWLSQRVPGLTAADVATTLPRASSATESVPWLTKGFVQVQAISTGRSLIDIPVRRPVLQVDCWAASPASSSKVPWNKAARLVELIRVAAEEDTRFGQPVDLPNGYLGARVQAVYLATDPNRITGDDSGYARFSLDLAVDWVRQ